MKITTLNRMRNQKNCRKVGLKQAKKTFMISQLPEGLFDHRKEWRRVLIGRVPFEVLFTAGNRLRGKTLILSVTLI